MIREFQVVTSGGIAEFGRASAGIINVLTQSGTNDWRGRLYGFWRDDALDAKNPLATTKDPLRQWQYGATVGGPLRRDRTFLFANFEQTRLDGTSVITITPANVAAVNAALDRAGYPGPRVTTGSFETGYTSTNLLARVDHRLDGGTLAHRALQPLRHREPQRPQRRRAEHRQPRHRARGPRPDARRERGGAGLRRDRQRDARAVHAQPALRAARTTWSGPAVNIAGVANLGTSTTSPTARDLDLLELVNVTTLQRGRHAFKAGVDLIWNRLDIEFPGALQGVYTFPSLPALQAGTLRHLPAGVRRAGPVPVEPEPRGCSCRTSGGCAAT